MFSTENYSIKLRLSLLKNLGADEYIDCDVKIK